MAGKYRKKIGPHTDSRRMQLGNKDDDCKL
jgi:hypothetical protein